MCLRDYPEWNKQKSESCMTMKMNIQLNRWPQLTLEKSLTTLQSQLESSQLELNSILPKLQYVRFFVWTDCGWLCNILLTDIQKWPHSHSETTYPSSTHLQWYQRYCIGSNDITRRESRREIGRRAEEFRDCRGGLNDTQAMLAGKWFELFDGDLYQPPYILLCSCVTTTMTWTTTMITKTLLWGWLN